MPRFDPLSYYFETIYPQNCPIHESFIGSKLGLSISCRIIALISLPIQIFTAYCILKKTPDNMKPVKGSLTNLNFWCAVSGIMFAFFVCPYFYLPYMAGVNIGLFTDWGVRMDIQFYIAFATMFAMIIAITLLFETRSSLITSNRFRIKSIEGRFIWIFVNFFGSMGIITPLFFNIPIDQMDAKMSILKTLPCPTIEFFTEPVLVIASEGFWETYMTTASIFIYLCLTVQVLFFSSCSIFYLFIAKNTQVSAQTRRLQIRSFFGLVLQTFIPIILVLVPLVMFIGGKKKDGEYRQYENNAMFIAICVQNGATSLSILLVHHPYRSFLKSRICGKERKREAEIIQVTSDLSIRT